MDIQKYWQAVICQQPEEMRSFFHRNALISWHNTNERFTVQEFIRANCEYPGQWAGEIERVEEKDRLIITVTRVFSQDRKQSFHVVSFIKTEGGKIVSLDEYWGDDGAAPEWRRDQHIGVPIR